MSKCSVYLIHSTSGHYKIGYSTDPQRRLRQLRKTQGPYEYSLVGAIVCDSVEEAREMESDLHEEFSDSRFNGEWFELLPMELVLVGFTIHRTIAKGQADKARQEGYKYGLEIGRQIADYQELPY